jgi:hypothetical protein
MNDKKENDPFHQLEQFIVRLFCLLTLIITCCDLIVIKFDSAWHHYKTFQQRQVADPHDHERVTPKAPVAKKVLPNKVFRYKWERPFQTLPSYLMQYLGDCLRDL